MQPQPSWTEVWGFYFSALGTVAAIVAVIRLFMKNKELENAIVELSKIAKHNESIAKLEELKVQPIFTIVNPTITSLDKAVVQLRNDGAKGSLNLFSGNGIFLEQTNFFDVVVVSGDAVSFAVSLIEGKEMKEINERLVWLVIKDTVGRDFVQEIRIIRVATSVNFLLLEQMERIQDIEDWYKHFEHQIP